jgi:hypothetical protein
MDGKPQFGLALPAAAAGGLSWGYFHHRGDRRVAVLASARQSLEHSSDSDDFDVERVTRIRQSVTEHTGTAG